MLSSTPFIHLQHRRAAARSAGHVNIFFHADEGKDDDNPYVYPLKYYFYSWHQNHGGPAKKLLIRDAAAGGGGLTDRLACPITKPLHSLVLIRCTSNGQRGGYYVFNPCTRAILPLTDSKLPRKMSSRFNSSLDVITFDVGDETFGSAPRLPVAKEEALWPDLTELDGCLCAYYQNNQRGRVVPITKKKKKKKIVFMTGACRMFSVDVDSDSAAGSPPEILFKPEDVIEMAIPMIFFDDDDEEGFSMPNTFGDFSLQRLGLFEDSLVPVGRTVEEILFSSPATTAWADVLKWLPASTVANLTLVCRSWRHMVATNRFIRSHAVQANTVAKHPQIKLVVDDIAAAGEKFTHVDDLLISGNRPKLCTTSTPFICSPPCHGLNLRIHGTSHFLFNPCMAADGYQLRIYTEDDDYTYSDEERMGGSLAGVIALGYDEAIERHVLVQIYNKYSCLCELMLVGDDRMQWEHGPSPTPVDIDVPAVYVNGKMYWVVEKKDSKIRPRDLLELDMKTRKFKVIRGPPCRRYGDGCGRMTLLELHGELCVACSDRSANAIDMWTAKDHGGGGGWSVERRVELAGFSPEYSSETATPMAVDPVDGRVLLNTGTSLGTTTPRH
uniref:F-box domain-containing protein n=1 Tax=Leersia perrieri TaxID=77586 RepID=A0A0D9VHK8_9ORYZ